MSFVTATFRGANFSSVLTFAPVLTKLCFVVQALLVEYDER